MAPAKAHSQAESNVAHGAWFEVSMDGCMESVGFHLYFVFQVWLVLAAT